MTLASAELGEGFWTVSLPQELDSPSKRTPAFQACLAARVYRGGRGFLSKSVGVAHMIEGHGDLHHIVPKNHLIKHGFHKQGDYNQVANFALTEAPINITIKDHPPRQYIAWMIPQVQSGRLRLGEITDQSDLEDNLAENAIPDFIDDVTADNYPEFLKARRQLMAAMIREYCDAL